MIGEYVLNTKYDVTQLFWRTRGNMAGRGETMLRPAKQNTKLRKQEVRRLIWKTVPTVHLQLVQAYTDWLNDSFNSH